MATTVVTRKLECPYCGRIFAVDEKLPVPPDGQWCPRCYATHDKKIMLVRVG